MIFKPSRNRRKSRSRAPSIYQRTSSANIYIPIKYIKSFARFIPIAALGSAASLLFNSPEKVQLWQAILFPKPIAFSCMGITVSVPHDWLHTACHPLANGPDATFLPKKFLSKEEISPKIELIAEDPYEGDITLQSFKSREFANAKSFARGKRNTVFKLDRKYIFNGDLDGYELIYDVGSIMRRDVGFLGPGRQYVIRYEATLQDFAKYQKEAAEIVNTIKMAF